MTLFQSVWILKDLKVHVIDLHVANNLELHLPGRISELIVQPSKQGSKQHTFNSCFQNHLTCSLSLWLYIFQGGPENPELNQSDLVLELALLRIVIEIISGLGQDHCDCCELNRFTQTSLQPVSSPDLVSADGMVFILLFCFIISFVLIICESLVFEKRACYIFILPNTGTGKLIISFRKVDLGTLFSSSSLSLIYQKSNIL